MTGTTTIATTSPTSRDVLFPTQQGGSARPRARFQQCYCAENRRRLSEEQGRDDTVT